MGVTSLRCVLASLLLLACSPTARGGPPSTDAATADGESTTDAPSADDTPAIPDAPPADLPVSADAPPVEDAPPASDLPTATDAPVVVDAPADVPVVSDVPSTDVPIAVDGGARCTSAVDCSAPTPRCDRATGACVACTASADCPTGFTCQRGACVAAVACTSSRTCPGQVCDTSAGVCVDCNVDVDCDAGQVCAGHVCNLPATLCRSSLDCAPFGRVCDLARAACVQCVNDGDCPSGQRCASSACVTPTTCAPGAMECLNLTTARTCNGAGAWVTAPCASGQTCSAGRCTAAVCSPGVTECASGTDVRTCNAQGTGYTTARCPDGANGAGICSGGGCDLACRAPFVDCNGGGADGCEANLQTDAANCGACGRRCAAGQSCAAGACVCAGAGCCAGGMTSCGGACVDTSSNPSHCGGCGVSCGASAPFATATCAASTCSFACQGEHYDVNGNVTDGCEVTDDNTTGHTQATSRSLGGQGCSDTVTRTITGRIVSDARTHRPAPEGFVPASGSASDWYAVTAVGGTFCVNNYDVRFTTTGGGSTECYRCTIITDRETRAVTTTGSGSARMVDLTSGHYTDDSTVFFRVEKFCSTAVREDVSYTIDFHL